MREYEWNGRTYQIADEDLCSYPGAVPTQKQKAAEAPKNKVRPVKDKSKEK